MLNPTIFREYDIRGIADTDLTDDKVYLFAQGVGTYYRSLGGNKIIVGRDVRISSPRISSTLQKGLNNAGCDVIDIGQVPTPVFYFSLFRYDIGDGIMITASHNPKEFNGFKIAHNKSTIYGSEIQKVKEIINKGDFVSGKGGTEKRDVVPAYTEHVLSNVKIKKGLRVVIDTGNGTCGPIVDEILKKIEANYHILYKEPDGNFPNHLPDPTVVKYITTLIDMVRGGEYDCGVGFDGDGDRIGVIDENGEIIWGDVLLAIYAERILQKMPGAKIIFEVKCSKGLIQRIEELGGVPLMYKTGHSLIKAKMKAEQSPLAGEMSGHIFFADRYYGYDDAIYAGLRLLEIIGDGEKLSALAHKIPKYYSTPEIRIETADEKKFEIVESLKTFFKKSYTVIDIDGIRVDFPDGWGLVRPSNTQPALVLRFEAKTEARLEEIKKLICDKLEEIKEKV